MGWVEGGSVLRRFVVVMVAGRVAGELEKLAVELPCCLNAKMQSCDIPWQHSIQKQNYACLAFLSTSLWAIGRDLKPLKEDSWEVQFINRNFNEENLFTGLRDDVSLCRQTVTHTLPTSSFWWTSWCRRCTSLGETQRRSTIRTHLADRRLLGLISIIFLSISCYG
jgi:hypothetical protein